VKLPPAQRAVLERLAKGDVLHARTVRGWPCDWTTEPIRQHYGPLQALWKRKLIDVAPTTRAYNGFDYFLTSAGRKALEDLASR
jgi:hypothetical protein